MNLENEKIIFLDIDGVLNVIEQGRDEFGQIFHQHFMDNLGFIIDNTGAKSVISSSWKASGVEYLRKMWKHRNIPGEIIGTTPFAEQVVNSNIHAGAHYDEIGRGHEIQHFIEEHNVKKYCIIDDDADMLSHQFDNFVFTYGNTDHLDCVDIGYGLTRYCAMQAIVILNR